MCNLKAPEKVDSGKFPGIPGLVRTLLPLLGTWVQSLVGNLDPHVAMPKTKQNKTKNNAIYHTDRLEKKNYMLISIDADKRLDKIQPP